MYNDFYFPDATIPTVIFLCCMNNFQCLMLSQRLHTYLAILLNFFIYISQTYRTLLRLVTCSLSCHYHYHKNR